MESTWPGTSSFFSKKSPAQECLLIMVWHYCMGIEVRQSLKGPRPKIGQNQHIVFLPKTNRLPAEISKHWSHVLIMRNST